MSSREVAVLSFDLRARREICMQLRTGGFEPFECVDLPIPSRLAGVVIHDHQLDEQARRRVRAWLKATRLARVVVVVVSARPVIWEEVCRGLDERVEILPSPAFSWELTDALRQVRRRA